MQRTTRGMSLIDVIVGVALILIVFLALLGLLRASVLLSAMSKSKAMATSIAESQVEYIRGLSYDSVGTIGGIPAGVVPQYATTTVNSITFVTRTFIDYYDDPADGIGGADSNGIITDYKRIKVTVSYQAGQQIRTVNFISTYTPQGLETTTGGGTLKIVVVNAASAPVTGATVSIVNASTSPTVNLTTFSDINGLVYLPGAATSSQYQIYVSKNGYSSAQTYARDSTNQNPTPGYLTVATNLTTTQTFAIDTLATLSVRTYTPVATTTFTDAFANGNLITQLNSTIASGGVLTLVGGPSSYVPSGSAVSTTTAPSYLAAWSSASSTITTPNGTTAVFHVVDSNGTLIPDSTLPGNSSGFSSSVNLAGVSTTTYPSLALRADLTTSSTTTAPTISQWGLGYMRGPVPLANVPFTLTGAKTVGSTGGGGPIYKTNVATTTSSVGQNFLTLEWDSYTLGLTAYDTVEACTPPTYVLIPGSVTVASLYLVPATANSVLVAAADASNVPVPGATVTVSRPGTSKTLLTSACGTAYFGSLASASDYTITVSKSGYTTDTNTGVTISGHLFYDDSL